MKAVPILNRLYKNVNRSTAPCRGLLALKHAFLPASMVGVERNQPRKGKENPLPVMLLPYFIIIKLRKTGSSSALGSAAS